MPKQHERIDHCATNCGHCVICCCFVCKHCGLFEGSLTTHCPDVPVGYEDSDLIYKGQLNFRGFAWIRGECSEHSPVFYKLYHKPTT